MLLRTIAEEQQSASSVPNESSNHIPEKLANRAEQKPRDDLPGGEAKVIGENENVSLVEAKKGLKAFSKEEQMEAVLSDAPELVRLLMELKDGLDDIRIKIEPLVEKVKEGQCATKDGISYLETKHLLLLFYCQYIVFYILLKAEGQYVRDHPVISRFIEIRMFLEKIRPIDKKLQYQIEKLLKLANAPSLAKAGGNSFEQTTAKEDDLKYRPNPHMLVSKIDQDAMESGGVYRPPMIAPTAMDEEKTFKDRRSKSRAEKAALHRASRSAFVKELANELEGRPEEIHEIVGTESKEMLQERARLESRAQQEEELFTRVPLSKAERQKLKHLKRSRNGLMGMLDDFDDDVVDLIGMEEDKTVGGPPDDLLKPSRSSRLMDDFGNQSKKFKMINKDPDASEDFWGRVKPDMQKSSKLGRYEEQDFAEANEGVESDEEKPYQETKHLKDARLAVKSLNYSRTASLQGEKKRKHQLSYQMERNKGHQKKLLKTSRKLPSQVGQKNGGIRGKRRN